MLRENDLIVASKKVVLPASKQEFSPAIIGISDGVIKEIELLNLECYEQKICELSSHGAVLDACEKIISPAFINAHTHIAMNIFRKFPVEQSTDGNMVENLFYTLEKYLLEDDVKAFAKIGAIENLLAGVGLVWDHYYYGKAIASACADVGLCAVIAPTLQDRLGPHCDKWERGLEETKDLMGSKWQKKHIYAALGPHASDTVSESLWRLIIKTGEATGLPLHMHLSQSREEVERSFAHTKLSPVAWLERLGLWQTSIKCLLVHGVYFTNRDLQLFDASRHTLGFCPFSQMIFAHPAPVWKWEEVGLPWVVATDCVASNDSMNIQKELKLVSGLPKLALTYSKQLANYWEKADNISIPKLQTPCAFKDKRFESAHWLLDKVWKIPGRLHPYMQAGELAVGALANMVIWDGDHPSMWPGSRLRSLAMNDSTAAINGLVVGGKVVGWGKNWQNEFLDRISYRELIEEANRRLIDLINRSGLRLF